MITSADDGKVAIARARDALEPEHVAVRGLLDTLHDHATTAKDTQRLLSELHKTLAKHFAHESYPGGFYDSIAAFRTELVVEIGGLVDEHFLLLSTTQSLRERAEKGEAGEARFRAELDTLIGRLLAHEKHELELVEIALDG